MIAQVYCLMRVSRPQHGERIQAQLSKFSGLRILCLGRTRWPEIAGQNLQEEKAAQRSGKLERVSVRCLE